MAGKKGGRVPQPSDPGDWTLRFLKSSVSDDWDKLCAQEVGAASASYDHMAKMPRARGARCTRLAGAMESKLVDGKTLERWQFEMTGGGRIFYLLDDDRKIVWVEAIHFGHPKQTEKKRG